MDEFTKEYEHWFDEDKRWTDAVKEHFKGWLPPEQVTRKIKEALEKQKQEMIAEKEQHSKFVLLNELTGKCLKKNEDGSFDDLYHYSASSKKDYGDVLFSEQEIEKLDIAGYRKLECKPHEKH